MTRLLLVFLLVLVIGRSAWRLLEGIVEGASGAAPHGPPVRSTRLVRDPVCGTWVVPSRALRVGDGARARYFCSERCLSEFRTRS